MFADGGITMVYFLAVGHNKPEETEIWVPDISLYNSGAAMTETLAGEVRRLVR